MVIANGIHQRRLSGAFFWHDANEVATKLVLEIKKMRAAIGALSEPYEITKHLQKLLFTTVFIFENIKVVVLPLEAFKAHDSIPRYEKYSRDLNSDDELGSATDANE